MLRRKLGWSVAFWGVSFMAASSACACIPGGLTIKPTCEFPAASADEQVVLIDSQSISGAGRSSRAWLENSVSSIAVGSDTSLPTQAIDLQVNPGSRKIYVVLGNDLPTIWRFTGDTQRVSRVVAFGSRAVGADGVGIVGIPRDKITFPKSNLTELWRKPIGACNFVANACDPHDYFFRADRQGNEPAIGRELTAVTNVPDPATAEPPIEDLGPYNSIQVISNTNTDTSHKKFEVKVDDIVAAPKVPDSEIRPGQVGLRLLKEQGILHKKGDRAFDAAIEKWAEARNIPYRSRFDPEFRFPAEGNISLLSATIDHLPVDVGGQYLLGDNVQLPRQLEKNNGLPCFVRIDAQLLGEFDCDPTSRVTDEYVNRVRDDRRIQKARLDDLRWFETASPEEIARTQTSASAIGGQSEAMLERRRNLKAPAGSCKLFNADASVYTVALTIQAGRTGSNYWSPKDSFDVEKKVGGEVDVDVRRKGKVLLYLGAAVASKWHIKVAPDTELVGIIVRDPPDEKKGLPVVEKPEGVAVKFIGKMRAGVVPEVPDCGAYWPPISGQLGGPAPLLIDKAMTAMTGKGLDHYIARQRPEDRTEATDFERWSQWYRDTKVEEFTTFVVE
jgi:hypothetical protein